MKEINKTFIRFFICVILSFLYISCNNAGATTAYNTQVSIVRTTKRLPNKAGNIFISDWNNNIMIYWYNDKELHIVVPNSEIRVYKKKEKFKDIKIVYE